MSRPVPHRARQFTAELEVRFARDAQLARKLNDAHARIRRTNDRLCWGLHRDPLANVYGEHRIAVEPAFAEDRSEVLGAPDQLQALQPVHRIDCDFQHVAEDRRHLAADIGEVIRSFVDVLGATGWSEAEARNAPVHEITGVEGDM